MRILASLIAFFATTAYVNAGLVADFTGLSDTGGTSLTTSYTGLSDTDAHGTVFNYAIDVTITTNWGVLGNSGGLDIVSSKGFNVRNEEILTVSYTLTSGSIAANAVEFYDTSLIEFESAASDEGTLVIESGTPQTLTGNISSLALSSPTVGDGVATFTLEADASAGDGFFISGLSFSAVPEPGSLSLCIPILGLLARRRKRRVLLR